MEPVQSPLRLHVDVDSATDEGAVVVNIKSSAIATENAAESGLIRSQNAAELVKVPRVTESESQTSRLISRLK